MTRGSHRSLKLLPIFHERPSNITDVMSTSEAAFVNKDENVPETNINPEKEDALAEQSDATGQVSKREYAARRSMLF